MKYFLKNSLLSNVPYFLTQPLKSVSQYAESSPPVLYFFLVFLLFLLLLLFGVISVVAIALGPAISISVACGIG